MIDTTKIAQERITDLPAQLAAKQDKLKAGQNIVIQPDNTIEAHAFSTYKPNLFDFKWRDSLCNDIQWVRADTWSWHYGELYSAAYQHLVDDINGLIPTTEVVEGITITYYQAADGHKIVNKNQMAAVMDLYEQTGIAWYYILDTTNHLFKLPRTKYGFTHVRERVGNYVKPGLPNIIGKVRGALTTLSGETGGSGALASSFVPSSEEQIYGYRNDSQHYVMRINFNASDSNPIYGSSDTVQTPATEMYLYFYVGQYTQEAIEQTAGVTTETLNAKADRDLSNLTEIGNITLERAVTAKVNEAMSTVFGDMYPVGSLYFSETATCPMAALITGSTWTKVSSGRVIQGSDSEHLAGTTIEPGLPNITGQVGTSDNASYYPSGAFYQSASSGHGNGSGGSITVSMDASRSNPIYGSSDTVQPPAYVVNIWKRTA